MNILEFKSSDKNKFLQNCRRINWEVICILFVFFFTGCAVLYSASGGDLNPLVKNHIIKFIFSSIVFIFILLISHKFIKSLSLYFYLISVVLLIFLIFFKLSFFWFILIFSKLQAYYIGNS